MLDVPSSKPTPVSPIASAMSTKLWHRFLYTQFKRKTPGRVFPSGRICREGIMSIVRGNIKLQFHGSRSRGMGQASAVKAPILQEMYEPAPRYCEGHATRRRTGPEVTAPAQDDPSQLQAPSGAQAQREVCRCSDPVPCVASSFHGPDGRSARMSGRSRSCRKTRPMAL